GNLLDVAGRQRRDGQVSGGTDRAATEVKDVRVRDRRRRAVGRCAVVDGAGQLALRVQAQPARRTDVGAIGREGLVLDPKMPLQAQVAAGHADDSPATVSTHDTQEYVRNRSLANRTGADPRRSKTRPGA